MRVTHAFKRAENAGKGLENITAKLAGSQKGNNDLRTRLHMREKVGEQAAVGTSSSLETTSFITTVKLLVPSEMRNIPAATVQKSLCGPLRTVHLLGFEYTAVQNALHF